MQGHALQGVRRTCRDVQVAAQHDALGALSSARHSDAATQTAQHILDLARLHLPTLADAL